MKRNSLLILLLSVLMVLSPALCAFADSETSENTDGEPQQEVTVDPPEAVADPDNNEDDSAIVEEPLPEEKAEKASEEQPATRGETKGTACSHRNPYTYFDYDVNEVVIEEIDDCVHTVTGKIYEVTFCEDCEEELGRVLCDDIDFLEEYHVYGSDHICTLCGHVNECEHKKYYTYYDYDPDPEKTIINDIGDKHSVTGYISKITSCKICEEDFLTEDLGYTTVYEDHDYEHGVCYYCGHKRNENWSDNWNYYYDKNGDPVTGWKEIDGDWYYFNGNGEKQTGWLKYKGYWYYMDPDETEDEAVPGIMATGWKKIGSKMYYFDAEGSAEGRMKTGWLKLTWTDEEDGETYTDWYYFNSGGAQLFGWQKISGKWYYFDEVYDDDDFDDEDYYAGYMVTGIWPVDREDKTYLFGSNGVWQSGFTGWKSETVILGDGEKYTYWYYFKKGTAVDGWQKISGDWYYFEYSIMASDRWASDSSGEYWMGSNGKITRKKWIQGDDRKWYYMGSNGHKTYNKWIKDSQGWCYLGDNGYMVTNDWAPDSWGTCWIGDKGYMVEENKWIPYEGNWYYIVEGYRVEDDLIWIGNDLYSFGIGGVCENPPS